jgi:hypothetical protein
MPHNERLAEIACADGVIDIGWNTSEILKHIVDALPAFDGEQRL